MRLRSWHVAPVVVEDKPRRIPWSRLLLMVSLCCGVAYIVVPMMTTIQADGLVRGRLAPITSLYRARVVQTMARCNQLVKKGQPIAVISNFILNADYVGLRQKNANSLAIEQVTQNDELYRARFEEEEAFEKYKAASIDAEKKKNLFASYGRAYHSGALGRLVWEEARSNWLAAEETAAAYHSEVITAKAHTKSITQEGNAEIRAFSSEAHRLDRLASRVQSEELFAPVSGYIVACGSDMVHSDQVIDPGRPLYKIFQTDFAYVVAYFNPSSVRGIREGDSAEVAVAGMDQPITGTVSALYPSQSNLPYKLEKFIWQKPQWSEYREVEISFKNLDPSLRASLMYDAKVHITIKRKTLPWQHA